MQDSKQADEPSLESPQAAETEPPCAAKSITRRLAPAVREKQIVEKAIQHFGTCGFSGSTRELARQLDVTQPLLYRYFPSKEALIDRVYEEVYQWDPSWEALIQDRSEPLQVRLVRFYTSYAQSFCDGNGFGFSSLPA